MQELEREREEIVNVFESQINNALEGLPSILDDSSSRTLSPSESVLASQQTKLGVTARPMTRESDHSASSRFSSTSRPVSVLRATQGSSIRKQPTRAHFDPFGSVDRLISDKNENIASRVASIQQKVSI